jgi:hypothetical protein
MYLRLNNVIRHELEHALQGSFFQFPSDIKNMAPNKLRDFIINYLTATSEMQARAMGGYLQANSQRVSVREVYDKELNRMIDNLARNFKLELDYVAVLRSMIGGLIEKQVQYLEGRIGEPLSGFIA